jgi:hypothetical protein
MYWCIALIDLTAPQPQPSADHAYPLRETIRMDADQGCRVVRDDGHPRCQRLLKKGSSALLMKQERLEHLGLQGSLGIARGRRRLGGDLGLDLALAPGER